MPRVSVIIPVYNVEAYIASCLESVRKQTFSDIEIICVNDGSIDRSLSIVRLCEQVDPRIVVVDKANGGVSSARNAGIEAAVGEFVCFLDSDDLLERNACARIVQAFEETGADVVTYGASVHPEYLSNDYYEKVLQPRDVIYEGFDITILKDEASWPFSWHSACRREFLMSCGIRFDEDVRFGEDTVFQFTMFPQAKVAAFISDTLMRYRVARSDSHMGMREGDALRIAQEHVHITDHVFSAWRKLGILDRYRDFALEWASEFVLYRALGLSEGRGDVCSQVRRLWAEYFEREYLVQRSDQPRIGKLTKFAMGDDNFASGCARWFALRDFEAYIRGVSSIRAVASEVKGFVLTRGVVKAMKRAAKAVLPLPANSYMQYREEDAWDAEERFRRQIDLELLLSEVEAARKMREEI